MARDRFDNNSINPDELANALGTIIDAADALRDVGNSSRNASRAQDEGARRIREIFNSQSRAYVDRGKAEEELARKLKAISDSLPDAMNNSIKVLNKNLAYMSDELQRDYKLGKSISKLGNEYEVARRHELKELQDAMDDLDSMINDIADESEKNAALDAKRILQQTYQERKNMSVAQDLRIKTIDAVKNIVIDAGKATFKALYDFAAKYISEGINKYNSTMEQTYNTITANNNYNKAQYNEMFERMKKAISENGLDKLININEFQDNIANTVRAGLLGKTGEINAMYATIADKMGVTFDWFSEDWVKSLNMMAKNGEDVEGYMKNIIASSKALIESEGNSFAFVNGGFQTITTNLSELVERYNLDEKAASNTFKSFASVSQMTSQYGVDSSTFIQDIMQSATEGIATGSTQKILLTNGMTSSEMQSLIKSGDATKILEAYMDNLQALYLKNNGEFNTVVTDALGSSQSASDLEKMFSNIKGSWRDEYKRLYNVSGSGEYDTYLSVLEQQETETQKIVNNTDNLVAQVGKLANEHPIWAAVLPAVGKSIASGVGTYIGGKFLLQGWAKLLGDKLGTSGAGGILEQLGGKGFRIRDLFTRGFGGSGTAANASTQGVQLAMDLGEGAEAVGSGAGTTSRLATIFTNGQGASKFTSVLGSTGAKFVGGAGGAIMVAADAISGYKNGGIGGAVKGGLTGVTKDVESGWDVAGVTAKNAAKGALIGTMFGPWGTAIGAVIGGSIGLATSLIDLNDEEKKHQREMAKATSQFQNLSKSIVNLEKAQNEYNQKVSETSSLDKITKSLKVGEKPTKELLSKFPELSVYLDKNGNATKRYVEELTRALDIQKQLNEIEYNKAVQEEAKNVYGTSSSYKTIAGDLKSKENKYNNALKNKEAITEFENALRQADSVYYDEYSRTLIINPSVDAKTGKITGSAEYTADEIADMYGITNDAYRYQAANRASQSDLVSGKTRYIPQSVTNTKDGYKFYGGSKVENPINWTKTESANANKQFNTIASEYNNAKTLASQNYGQLQQLATNWNTTWSTQGLYNNMSGVDFSKWASGAGWDITKYKIGEESAGSFANVLWNYNYALNEMIKNGYGTADSLSKTFLSPKSLLKSLNESNKSLPNVSIGTPAFATGTDFVPADNYIALLHRGEQVRTAAEVAVERAEQHVASTNVSVKIHDSLITQTNSIISLLTDIDTILKVISGRSAKDNTKTFDYRLPQV